MGFELHTPFLDVLQRQEQMRYRIATIENHCLDFHILHSSQGFEVICLDSNQEFYYKL